MENDEDVTLRLAVFALANELLYCHPFVQFPAEVRAMIAKKFGPFGENHAFAIGTKHAIVSAISRLLSLSCPAAILWFVIAFIVKSVDAVIFARPSPHVGKEVCKRTIPSFTDRHAPGPVKMPFTGFWIRASLPHGFPDRILRKLGHSMRSGIHWAAFGLIAATALCRAGSKLGTGYETGSSAIAATFPYSAVRLTVFVNPNDSQAIELASGHVDESWIGGDQVHCRLQSEYGCYQL